MSKFRIEIQITLLVLIIGAAVVTSGYFAYQSLSDIIDSIHQEALPDNKLFLIKDVNSDLTALENNVRLYVLSNNDDDLSRYQTLQKQISGKLQLLQNLNIKNKTNDAIADSIQKLYAEKLDLWQGVLSLHQSVKGTKPAFKEIYSKLEEQKIDTITIETEKKGFFRKIFGGKKVIVDTTYVERPLERNSIKQEIQDIETDIEEKGRRINVLESRFIGENIVLSEKINNLIAEAEKRESDNFTLKTIEADRLAEITYKRMAAYIVAAIILLLTSLFILFNYLKKTRASQLMLNKAKLEAENLAKAKEQFAANVSHELRTPVNAIYGLTDQILQKPLDKETKELFSVMARSASHLKNIINDTLDFSKIQAKKLKFESVDFAPSEIFNEVLSLHFLEASQKGISLLFHEEGEKPEALIGDPLRLKQILINLISNAIKFTEKGEVKLSVRTAALPNKKFEVKMEVLDTGIGISEKHLKIIFDEFVQAENQSGKKHSGTGLGLAIVKKLVELQGGEINVESKPGFGTKVTVVLYFPEGKKENIKKDEGHDLVFIPDKFKKLNYLIADDEEFNRLLLRGILNKWGANFIEVTNGAEAVRESIHKKFDVILMDLQMPEMNGFEATKEILKVSPDTVIIPTTATNELTDRQLCINLGMKGFLLKPFSERELFNILISAIPNEKLPNEKNRENVINTSDLLRLANNDKKFLKEMILLFIKSTESGVQSIHEAIHEGNRLKVMEYAHKMAAPCKHMQAKNLYDYIKKLEKIAQNNEDPDSLNFVFQSVKNEAIEVISVLYSYLNTNFSAEQ